MVSPIKDISVKKLMERWDLELAEFRQVPIKGYISMFRGVYPVFDPQEYPSDRIDEMVSKDEEIVDIGALTYESLMRCRFKLSDVYEMEEKYSELSNDPEKTISGKEKRELGRLRREKEKWDRSIAVAVKIGIYVNKSDRPIIRRELFDKVGNIDSSLPITTTEMIWDAIPANLRKGPGRPSNKKS